MKSLLAYGASTFFPRIYAFLAIFLFSRMLSVHDFGLYVLVIAAGEFCDFTANAWFRIGFLRLYHPGNIQSSEQRLDLNSSYKVSLRCIGVAVILSWLSAIVLLRHDWLIFAIVTSLYVIGNGTVQASLNTLRGEGRAITYASIEALRPLTNLSLGFAAIKFVHPSFEIAAFGVFGGNALIGTITFATIWSRRAHRGGNDRVREIIEYSWPLLFSCILAAVMNAADRYQLQWWLGPQAVALYAAAYAIGRQPIDILFNALNLGAFTELMRRYDMEGPAAASKLLGRQIALMLGVTLPLVVGISLLAPDILHLLFDRRYWVGTPQLVPIIALMAFFAGLKNYGYDQGFYMVRRTGMQVLSMLPSVVAGVLVSAILINIFGLSGAAYGGLIGYAGSLMLSRKLVRQSLPGSLPWMEIAKIVTAAALMAVAVEISHHYGAPGKIQLLRTVSVAIVTYFTAILTLDVLGARRRLRADLRLSRL